MAFPPRLAVGDFPVGRKWLKAFAAVGRWRFSCRAEMAEGLSAAVGRWRFSCRAEMAEGLSAAAGKGVARSPPTKIVRYFTR